MSDGRGQHGNHVRGPAHHRWNDGRMITADGYVKVRVGVDHPLADPNGYAYEHLIVWVSAGRPAPKRGEVLRHRNNVRSDNRLSNLLLTTRASSN